MSYDKQDFEYLNDSFVQAEEPKPVPSGKYVTCIESLEAKEAKNSESIYLSVDLVVTEGEYEGRHIRYMNGIPAFDEEPHTVLMKLGFMKLFLRIAGIDVDSPQFDFSDFIASRLSELLDVCLEVTVGSRKDQKGNDQQTVYVNSRVDTR